MIGSVCRVLCDMCCVLCAECCVLHAVCCVLCAVQRCAGPCRAVSGRVVLNKTKRNPPIYNDDEYDKEEDAMMKMISSMIVFSFHHGQARYGNSFWFI